MKINLIGGTKKANPIKANFKPGFGIDVGAYSCDIIMIVYGNQPQPSPPIRVADKSLAQPIKDERGESF